MRTMRQLTVVLLAGIGSANLALAGGTTGACTPPEGKIDVQPNQVCNGTQTVAIGKEITLKALTLKDKDCDCGRGVQDTINTSTGVRWSVGGGIGTLDGGTDGTPKKYTAPPEIRTSLAVRLQVDDEATSTGTYDDGGFIEVSNLNLDVVAPDDASWTTTTVSPTCPAGEAANKKQLVDTVSRTGCTVDFEDLNWTEDNNPQNVSNGCGFGPGIFGPNFIMHIGPGNTVDNGMDDVGFPCTSQVFPPSCLSGWSLDWKASRSANYSSGTWYTVITRTYDFVNPTGSPTDASGLLITASK